MMEGWGNLLTNYSLPAFHYPKSAYRNINLNMKEKSGSYLFPHPFNIPLFQKHI